MKKIFLILCFAFCANFANAQLARWQPAVPRVGDVVTIYFDTRLSATIHPNTNNLWLHWGVLNPNNGNWSTPPQSIWPVGSRLHTDNIAVQSPMIEGVDSVWHVTIDFDTTVHDIAFVFTDGGNNWDSNSGNNWELTFLSLGTVSWWSPQDGQPGDAFTIYYDAVRGTLPDNPGSVILHWGINESSHGNWHLPPQAIWPAGTVAQGQAARTPMILNGNGVYQLTIQTNDTIRSLHYVTTDGTNYDNNNNLNWDILLTEPPVVTYTHHIFRFDPRSVFAPVLPGPVNAVNLAGTFNSWSTTANPLNRLDPYGNRWAEVLMPIGYNEYKFVINGNNWQSDPDNPVTAPGGFNNSVLVLEADTLPQVYDITPNENSVSAAGTAINVNCKVRPGDLGTGLQGTPVALVNGNIWPTIWNNATSTLSFNAIQFAGGSMIHISVTAMDSSGRVGHRYFAYGVDTTGFYAVDPQRDWNYNIGAEAINFDLESMSVRELSNGDSLEFNIRLGGLNTNTTEVLLTIASSLEGFSDIEGLSAELNLPNLSLGGAAILLLNPNSIYFDSGTHNRVLYNGEVSNAGPQARVSFNPNNRIINARVALTDLENSLGSYQSSWFYSCASFIADSASNGFCKEISETMGGEVETSESDAMDILFIHAADVQKTLFHNYGLTRRTTLDAPGRGVESITPQEIGPHIAASGPVCAILTRGAETTDTTQTIVGRITSTAAIEGTWLVQNGVWHSVSLSGDSFVYNAVLVEGENLFSAWAVDANDDSGRSPNMTFTLVIDHAPDTRLTTRVESNQCVLDASTSVDPEGQTISYLWSADSGNPAQVTLIGENTATARFNIPQTPGEYYFNVTATDPNNHSRTAQTFFTVSADSAHGFSNNECADWVKNAIIYEIFPRSFSAQGNFAGITARLDEIENLGVNCIWLMPIFEGPSDHGYEITDYYTIEQDYGSEADFHELVNAAHARGIKVILDMVINHTSINHPFMQDALRHGRYSHYWDYYDRDASGNPTHYFDWTSLPNLNLNNTECANYFINMCKYWIQEFDIDGYRCDVAWGPMQRSPQFWVRWRQVLKETKPDILLLAEAGANDFNIFTNRFDLAFDWNLHHEGSSAFSHMFPQIPGFTNLSELVTNYGVGWPAYKFPLRFMENHDEVRYISENTAPQTKLVASLTMAIPGDVMLYAGQEIGVTSQRGLIDWNSDPNGMYTAYHRLTNARKALSSLRTGAFTQVTNTQPTTCYSFARYGNGKDPVIFVGNFSPNSQVVTITSVPQQLGLNPDSSYVVTEILTGQSSNMTGTQIGSIVTSLSAYQSRLWVISDSVFAVDAPEPKPQLPEKIALLPAYPNPFNPSTVLPLELNKSAKVTLKIYNILGREIATVVDEVMEAGIHKLIWDGKSSNSIEVGSGIYFAVMNAGEVRQVQKLVLMK